MINHIQKLDNAYNGESILTWPHRNTGEIDVQLRKIDLNLLLLLDVLIEERSVTRTAKRLSMTQPALSNALNRLRETLNDPLLERTNEGMEPTPYALSIRS